VNKNIYLTPQEQQILGAILPSEIADVGDIYASFPNFKKRQINKICFSLSSKGYLHRLRKGLYLVQEKPSEKPAIKNPHTIALAMFKGYMGFSSALRIYNLLEYEPFTIFVVTQNKSGSRILGEYTFRAVAMGKKAVGMTFYSGIYISTLSKTFFDCFYKPQYAGGYSVITKALNETNLDWMEFMRYFELASSSMCQRTGYVLDAFGKETGKVPEYILDFLRKRIKNNTKLLPSGKSKGKYSREWMVMDNLGRENILSWWYHG